jgi:hypothetical protein
MRTIAGSELAVSRILAILTGMGAAAFLRRRWFRYGVVVLPAILAVPLANYVLRACGLNHWAAVAVAVIVAVVEIAATVLVVGIDCVNRWVIGPRGQAKKSCRA